MIWLPLLLALLGTAILAHVKSHTTQDVGTSILDQIRFGHCHLGSRKKSHEERAAAGLYYPLG